MVDPSDDVEVAVEAGDADLAVVVERERTGKAIDALRAEGVYDDSRRVRAHDGESNELPVVEPPAETSVRAVIEQADPERRVTGLDDLLRERGWSEEEVARAPNSWAVVGDVVLVRFPDDCPRCGEVGEALRSLQGADTVLARGGISGPHREPDVEVVAGSGDTETVHAEHGTRYALDLSAVMFSPGNKTERARMGEVAGETERVLDAFAGIGYFALPMARAGARVTAVERNPVAFRYLVENAVLNGVEERLRPFRGDCREVVPALADAGERFDRLVAGHYDAHEHLDALLPALAPDAVVHLHEATPEARLWERPVSRLEAAARERDREVTVLGRRRVKSHSEGVYHVVVDARIE